MDARQDKGGWRKGVKGIDGKEGQGWQLKDLNKEYIAGLTGGNPTKDRTGDEAK